MDDKEDFNKALEEFKSALHSEIFAPYIEPHLLRLIKWLNNILKKIGF